MKKTTRAPVITQKMLRHVNGGSKFSEMYYRIEVDGEPTGITLYWRTDGSPHYRYTAHELRCGEDRFDLMVPHEDATAWILAHRDSGPTAEQDGIDEETRAIFQEARRAQSRLAEQMPTEEDAIRALFDAHRRLKDLGWREPIYAPRDGTYFDSIEPGSTGVHLTSVRMLKHEHPTFWIDADNDSWPARPILWRPRLP